jgi:hypothetical protein
MSSVEPSSKGLQQLLKDIHAGRIQLPDLQRDFKWRRPQVKALLDTIQRNHPTGALLFLETPRVGEAQFGSTTFKFAPANPTKPSFLVLDGQQRLTSCYLALYNGGHDRYDASYYVDLKALFALHLKRTGSGEIEFGETLVAKGWNSNPSQFLGTEHWLPLSLLREGDDPNRKRGLLKEALRAYRNGLRESEPNSPYFEFIDTEQVEGYLDAFYTYQFPVIELPDSLSIAAVCKIFETINSRGLKLGAFDLAVATFKGQGENLKQRWNAARESELVRCLDKDGTNVLQTVALLAGRPSKKAGLPANLRASDLRDHWDRAVQGVELAATFVSEFGAGSPPRADFLPYDGIIPSLAAVLLKVEDKAASESAKQYARRTALRWYFTSALGQRYNEGTDVVQANDYREVSDFALRVQTEIPAGLARQPWGVQAWSSAAPNTGAIGKALKCLLNHMTPKDPLTLAPLGIGPGRAPSQLHHIFPKAYMKTKLPDGLKDRRLNSVINQTYLSDKTNRIISASQPSKYINPIILDRVKSDGVSEDHARESLRVLLRNHLIDDQGWDALMNDDFDAFLTARAREFARAIGDNFAVQLLEVTDADEEAQLLGSVVDEDQDDDDTETYFAESVGEYAAAR